MNPKRGERINRTGITLIFVTIQIRESTMMNNTLSSSYQEQEPGQYWIFSLCKDKKI